MTAMRLRSYPAFLLFTAGLIAAEVWIVSLPTFRVQAGLLSTAVTLDLLIGIPLLGYLLLVRGRNLPVWSLVPLFVLAIGVAHLVVPRERRVLLDAVETILPLLELAVLAAVAFNARAIARAYRELRPRHLFAIEALREAVARRVGVPLAVEAIATEFSLLYWAFAGWRASPNPRGEGLTSFPYHRKGSYSIVVAAISMAVVIETVGLHLLFALWTPIAAWIATGLSVYSLIWIVGDYQAMRLHPIVVSPARLHLRLGMRWAIDVRRDEVCAIHDTIEAPKSECVRFSALAEPDFWIELDRPREVRGLFGIRREARYLGIAVEDPASLRDLLARP